jgi:hypothetical protein
MEPVVNTIPPSNLSSLESFLAISYPKISRELVKNAQSNTFKKSLNAKLSDLPIMTLIATLSTKYKLPTQKPTSCSFNSSRTKLAIA